MINFTRPIEAPDIPFTAQQLAPMNNTTDRAILINSTAGSGKTAVLQRKAFENQEKRVLYLAYNKNIVEDIRQKLPLSCEVSTFHAFGLKIIRESPSMKNMKVDFGKYRRINKQYAVINLISKHLSLGGGASRIQWEATCDRYHLDKRYIPEAAETLLKGHKQTNIISAEDMISQPVRENYDFPEYDLVLVDE